MTRVSYPVVPPHSEYSLTELGQKAAAKVPDLANWIEDRLPGLNKPTSGD